MHGCCWQHGCILLRLQTTEQTMTQKKIMDRFIKWLLSLNYIFSPFFFKDRGAVPCALLYFIAFWHFEVLSYCSHRDAIKHKRQSWTTKFCSPSQSTPPPFFSQSLSSEVKNVLFWRKSYWDAFNAICYIQRAKKTCSRFTKKRECCSKKQIPSRRREREAHHS